MCGSRYCSIGVDGVPPAQTFSESDWPGLYLASSENGSKMCNAYKPTHLYGVGKSLVFGQLKKEDKLDERLYESISDSNSQV